MSIIDFNSKTRAWVTTTTAETLITKHLFGAIPLIQITDGSFVNQRTFQNVAKVAKKD